MPLETIITEINLAGFQVLNLFQLAPDQWQANLWDGEKSWNFARGGSAQVALQLAFEEARGSPGEPVGQRLEENLLDDLL